jgi:hypothetical protein
MMQLCRYSRDVKNHPTVRVIINYTYSTRPSGTTHYDDGKSGVQHAICNMRVSGIVAPSEGIMRALPGRIRKSEPKHAVREGLLTLTDDMRSGASLACQFMS